MCYIKEELEKEYPVGTKIRLLCMVDLQAPPRNTKGVVKYIDDMCQIHMKWDNGSTLALVPGQDSFIKIEK